MPGTFARAEHSVERAHSPPSWEGDSKHTDKPAQDAHVAEPKGKTEQDDGQPEWGGEEVSRQGDDLLKEGLLEPAWGTWSQRGRGGEGGAGREGPVQGRAHVGPMAPPVFGGLVTPHL